MPALAQDWQAGAGADWQQTLAAARKEGTLTLVGPPELGKPMSEGFKRDTGIEMEFLGLVGAAQVQRMTREYKSDQVTMDVIFSGAIVMPFQQYMEPWRPKLVLPGVTDPKNWVDGKLKFADFADTYVPYFGEQVSGFPYVNSDLVKPGTVKSWQDFLKPEFKGKIAIYDPRVPGPGTAMSSYIADGLGMDYFKKLYVDQQPKLSRDGRQLVEWITRGVYPVALGVSTSDAEGFRSAGIQNIGPLTGLTDAPLRLTAAFYPHVPAHAPHPNAAAVFMNWYASKPGQEANSRAQQVWSRRTDVEVAGMPAYTRPKPGVKYIDQYTEDYVVNRRDQLIEQIRKLLGEDK